MAIRIYLSPERRPKPHSPYYGYPGIYEHDVCCEIAEYTKNALIRCGFEVKIASPNDNMKVRVAEGISWKANYYMPIHTNAATATLNEGTARGPCVLRYGKEGGISDRACKIVYKHLMAIYPNKSNRRNPVYERSDFYEIGQTPMLSVYPELAFHDNHEDADWLVNNKKEIAEALCKGVCEWYSVNYINPASEPTNTVPKAKYDEIVKERDAYKQKYDSLVISLTNLYESLK